MNETAASNLVKKTFESPFDRECFLIFAKNLFHFLDTDPFIYRGNLIPDAYDSHIKTLERIGKYEDVEGNKIDILAVCLDKQSSLERARTMQRNFIAWYLNGSRGGVAKDAALVAFYTKDSDDWRLSLVKMDYHLGESKGGKIKAVTDLTPARRYSFLVGANENTHTAQRQLLPILEDSEFKPRLATLESAFSVEVVTKDFFEKYKQLFLDAKEALDAIVAKDVKIKDDFQKKNIDTTDFTKKLLGQIVFLYFLQKKGWFGVDRDAVWGTGPKDFLRRLFEKQIADYGNFFNNILEPLFYEALAIERPDDFYSRFDCRIPFLNGGLFDPLGNYDWVHTDIYLPDDLFSNNRKTKDGDVGDGILDVFDRYNFTVKEDEPLEREVAVDPEMLGKAFENLLEVKDRKSKGTYYTPREIVHYMCQESLINYLLTELAGKVKRDDIETLIHLGETAIEHDKVVLEHGEEKGRYIFKLPQSIRDNASFIDEKLEKIRVCDPAVGSGAFLVGMMTEVIRVRNILTGYLSENGRSIYDFKRHAIQNCLYGVDIDPGAVEIAKLRLWLSLIVDEEDIKQIKPLPNLDYKIMQGNSLLEEYEGVKLDVDGHGEPQQMKFDQAKTESEVLKERLADLRKEFFRTAHKSEKDKLKEQIEDLTWQLVEVSLKEQKKLSLLPEIERFKKTNIKPFFLWKLNFSEVFEKNGGFDVVIANPPYVRATTEEGSYQNFRKTIENCGHYKTLYEQWDLFIPFIEQGLYLNNHRGYLSYIVPNSICTSKFAYKLLDLIQAKYYVDSINYFEDVKVFEAGVIPIIINIRNSSESKIVNKIIRKNDFNSIVSDKKISIDEFKSYDRDAFRKEFNVIKIDVPVIDLNNICYINYGIHPNSHEKYWKGEFTAKDIISDIQDSVHIRPYIEGKDIDNYCINKIRYLEWNTDRVPKKLRRATFPELYTSPKIMRGRITGGIYDDTGLISNDSIVILVRFIDLQGIENTSIKISIKKSNTLTREELEKLSKDFDLKYILAIINSNFAYKYLNNIRKHRMSNYFYADDIRRLPIATIPLNDQEPFINLVEKIINLKKSNFEEERKQASAYEKKIDQLVYKLYSLTPEEITIVEGTTK